MFNTEQAKEVTASLINQAKENHQAINGITASNVKQFNRYNPALSSQAPWVIAAMRRSFVTWVTLPFIIQQEFWNTWSNVMYPESVKPKEQY